MFKFSRNQLHLFRTFDLCQSGCYGAPKTAGFKLDFSLNDAIEDLATIGASLIPSTNGVNVSVVLELPCDNFKPFLHILNLNGSIVMAVESDEMVFSVISNLAQPFDDEEIAMNITYFASGAQFKISLALILISMIVSMLW